MSLQELLNVVTDKGNFQSVKDFIQFCQRYLIFTVKGLQAIIVSQNESNYRFFQYKEDGHYNITRPINFNLMYTAETGAVTDDFLRILRNSSDLPTTDDMSRAVIRNSIYTIQQSIGATLDALPVGKSNVARKINGDLFERFILLLVREAGIDCRSGVIRVPMVVDGMKEFSMSYQHDLLLYQEDELKVIGSVKTSSKDRLDKIFIDK
ncbi:MAG: hypothetical protein WCI88_16845, partial [Chloroflexota bacterium]